MSSFRTQPLVDASGDIAHPHRLIQAAAELGYLYFPGLIDEAMVRQLRTRVLAVCMQLGLLNCEAPIEQGIASGTVHLGGYEDPGYLALVQRILPTPEFTALGRNESVLDILKTLFDGPVEEDKGSVLRAFSPGQPQLTTAAHQDHYYLQDMPVLWTAWIPLGECPVEMGGLAVLPGSHHGGLVEHVARGVGEQIISIPEEAVWATGDFSWGDVLMFSSLTIHRSSDNKSQRLRLSADFRYTPLID